MNTEVTSRHRILVIDDDAAFNRVLCRALARRGYAVASAHTAAEALTLAERECPAMIVLDLNLAGTGGSMSGLALVAPLKRACPNGNIVVLTGYASIATAVEAIKLGARHYLAKPVDVDALLAAFGTGIGAPDTGIADSPPPGTPLSVDRMEWEHIQRILLEHGGNISATARALKMHRRTLQRKLGKRPARF
ncbi:MAG: response regulator transcription factor [Proteobacteria bacterium]|nr:response regulator transcription factor [Pseudomonadota bacterium]